jgi:hypothetical protein
VSVNPVVLDHRQSQFLPPVLAFAALAGAAGVLAAGTLLIGDGGGSNPTDGRVHPGKVSVLGRAKVRTWSGQTFSLQVPLKWQKIVENPATHTYAWAEPSAGGTLSSAAAVAQAAGDWSKAKDVARTRLTVQLLPSSAGRDAEASARAFARSDPLYTNGFLDLGPVVFGPRAWRFNVSMAGTVETHYFFSTCADGRRRESWHITIDRAGLQAQQAGEQARTISSIFSSLKTTFPGSRSASRDCAA